MTVDERPKRYQKLPADTPGAKPQLYDEVLAAGSDGTPRLYKMHREVKREIGDDSNQHSRSTTQMPGRVSAVAFNPDGSKFAAVSSLDGKGEVRVYDANTGAKVDLREGDRPGLRGRVAPETASSSPPPGSTAPSGSTTPRPASSCSSFVVMPKAAATTGAK